MSDAAQDWAWWWGSWRNLIRCGDCGALMDFALACPVCGKDYRQPHENCPDGSTVPQVFQGPLDWSPYVFLRAMHQDWCRTVLEGDLPHGSAISSPRAGIVLLFWTYFETLMAWFYTRGAADLPPRVAEDLLNRYSGIGARLDRLHRILFGCTWREDLQEFGHDTVAAHLAAIQKCRNRFAHGDPSAITEALVHQTVAIMPAFHAAWIGLYNSRCAMPPGHRR